MRALTELLWNLQKKLLNIFKILRSFSWAFHKLSRFFNGKKLQKVCLKSNKHGEKYFNSEKLSSELSRLFLLFKWQNCQKLLYLKNLCFQKTLLPYLFSTLDLTKELFIWNGLMGKWTIKVWKCLGWKIKNQSTFQPFEVYIILMKNLGFSSNNNVVREKRKSLSWDKALKLVNTNCVERVGKIEAKRNSKATITAWNLETIQKF